MGREEMRKDIVQSFPTASFASLRQVSPRGELTPLPISSAKSHRSRRPPLQSTKPLKLNHQLNGTPIALVPQQILYNRKQNPSNFYGWVITSIQILATAAETPSGTS